MTNKGMHKEEIFVPDGWEEVTDPEYVIQKGDQYGINRNDGPWLTACSTVGCTLGYCRSKRDPGWRVIRPRRAAQETSTVNQKEPAMKLFIVAVVSTPTDPAISPTILVNPTLVLAKDENTARMKAVQAIQGADLDQCEVLVRPF